MSAMRVKVRLISKSFLIVFLLVVVAACGVADLLKVQHASERFHVQFKESKFHDIYRQASVPLLKSTVKEEDFVAKLRETSLKVGEIREVKRENKYQVPTELRLENSVLITDTYSIKSANGSFVELIDWELRDGKVALAGYDCLPDTMN